MKRKLNRYLLLGIAIVVSVIAIFIAIQPKPTELVKIPECPPNPSDYAPHLPRWKNPVLASYANKHCERGIDGIEHITLLQGATVKSSWLPWWKEEGYWLLWEWKGDFWFTFSPDGRSWKPTERMPVPLNTEKEEFDFSLIQGRDEKYYMIFFSNRENGSKGYQNGSAYATSSSDMKHWTVPVQIIDKLPPTTAVGRRNTLLQLKDGSFSFFFTGADIHKINVITSNDFNHWSAPQELTFPNQIPYQAYQDKTGKFWMLAQYLDNATKATGDYYLTPSPDGYQWGEPIHVTSSTLARTPENWQPNCDNEWACNKAKRLWPILFENQNGEFVLAWRKGISVAVSRSKDGREWTPSAAEPIVNGRGSMRYADRYPIIQGRDGTYIIAYNNAQQEIWVSFSKNPFY